MALVKLNNRRFFGTGQVKTYLEKIHEKKGGKKSETVNQDTSGKELRGEGKENGGIARDKLRNICFLKCESLHKVTQQWESSSKDDRGQGRITKQGP